MAARTRTNSILACSGSMPMHSFQWSHFSLPSKSMPPFSAHMGLSPETSPFVACCSKLRNNTRRSELGEGANTSH